MSIFLETLSIKTSKREEIIDITEKIQNILSKYKKTKIEKGICRIFVHHTTAGITINENADPNVKTDLLNILRDLIPKKESYHHQEGNSDAHMKSSLMGSSKEVIISNHELVLGTWQGIMLCEFDGPRTRKITIQIQSI